MPPASLVVAREVSGDIFPSTSQHSPPQQIPAATGIGSTVVTVQPPTSNVVKVHQIAKLRSVLEVAEDFLGQGLV